MMRRSRGVLLLVSISFIKLRPESQLGALVKNNFLEVKKALLSNSHVKHKSYTNFDKMLDKNFTAYLEQKQRNDETIQNFSVGLDLSNNKDLNEIRLPEYLLDPKLELPQIQNFDPRFTIGVIVHYLADQISKGKVTNKSELKLPYFHWSDFLDISLLNEYFYAPHRQSCQMFDTTASGDKSPLATAEVAPVNRYCFDDARLNIMKLKSNDKTFQDNCEILKQQPHSTGFHVHQWTGRSSMALRPVLGKSYLNDFMPPPASLVMLLPERRSIEINIEQDIIKSKRSLINTELVSQYVEKFRKKHGKGKPVTLNIMNELSSFLKLVRKKSDLLHPEVKLTYSKELTHSQFVDNSSMIVSSMKAADGSVHDKMYFNSLQQSLSTKQPGKYFNEARFIKTERNYGIGGHYDWRFFNGVINGTPQHQPALHQLIQAWLKFTTSHNITTWVAHGTLLGWYWDGLAFPWDGDSDVQMPIAELHKLSHQFNQSIIIDLGNDPETQQIRYGRYFLDCGTYISHRVRGNGANNIDARFIDIDTGLYVDITGLAVSETRGALRYDHKLPRELARTPANSAVNEFMRNDYVQIYNCRNNHFSSLSELSPLRISMHEGEFTYVPNDVEASLTAEYSPKSLKALSFRSFTFLPRLRNWMASRTVNNYMKQRNVQRSSIELGDRFSVKDFEEEAYIQFLLENNDVLLEYLLTRDITNFHEREIRQIIDKSYTGDLYFDEEANLKIEGKPIRQDCFTLKAIRSNYDFYERTTQTWERMKTYLIGTQNRAKAAAENNMMSQPLGDLAPKTVPVSEKRTSDPKVGAPVVQTQKPANVSDKSKNRIEELPPM
ncbi:regulator of cell wall mannosyl phosphorylation [Scheffersomyces xylosifermentans]|uniref:regulator of cell wall mannosyl phosphorylation n=1 Tax=Scheffersomyces xylosifermentans TaxID=1304137 RepID=UPI00315D5FF9